MSTAVVRREQLDVLVVLATVHLVLDAVIREVHLAIEVRQIVMARPSRISSSERSGRPSLSDRFRLKDYFKGRQEVELADGHALNMRARQIILNLVYFDSFGVSPFKVRFKGNEPHIDHIYPQSALLSKLGLGSGEINAMGNYRFIGALDNIRKRAELPSTYFKRLKSSGVDIKRHLLLDEYASDPDKLVFTVPAYREFAAARSAKIVEVTKRVVNPELP